MIGTFVMKQLAVKSLLFTNDFQSSFSVPQVFEVYTTPLSLSDLFFILRIVKTSKRRDDQYQFRFPKDGMFQKPPSCFQERIYSIDVLNKSFFNKFCIVTSSFEHHVACVSIDQQTQVLTRKKNYQKTQTWSPCSQHLQELLKISIAGGKLTKLIMANFSQNSSVLTNTSLSFQCRL